MYMYYGGIFILYYYFHEYRKDSSKRKGPKLHGPKMELNSNVLITAC